MPAEHDATGPPASTLTAKLRTVTLTAKVVNRAWGPSRTTSPDYVPTTVAQRAPHDGRPLNVLRATVGHRVALRTTVGYCVLRTTVATGSRDASPRSAAAAAGL
jgi:hypothetical protein